MNAFPHRTHYKSNSRNLLDQTVARPQHCSLRFHHLLSLPTDGFTAYPARKTTLTEFMLYQKRCKSGGIPPELTVSVLEKGIMIDKHITDSVQSRTLGINLSNNLTWDKHLLTGKKVVLPSIRKQLGALATLKYVMSNKAKLQLVNALVMSCLTYLICVWGNTSANYGRQQGGGSRLTF